MPSDKSAKVKFIMSTFYCGLITYVVNVPFYLSKAIPLALFTGLILPGFPYGTVLVSAAQQVSNWNRVLFVLMSGELYILCSWFATDLHLEGHNEYFFVYASVFGACGLFIFYYVLIQKSLILWKGLILSVIVGSTTSILPGIAYTRGLIESSTGFPYNILITMSIFLTWQTLFGATLVLSSSPATANMSFAKKWL